MEWRWAEIVRQRAKARTFRVHAVLICDDRGHCASTNYIVQYAELCCASGSGVPLRRRHCLDLYGSEAMLASSRTVDFLVPDAQ